MVYSDDCDILFCLPPNMIQLQQLMVSEPYLSIYPFSLLDTHVSVPPDLYLVGDISGEVDIRILAYRLFIFNVDVTAWCICGQEVIMLSI